MCLSMRKIILQLIQAFLYQYVLCYPHSSNKLITENRKKIFLEER